MPVVVTAIVVLAAAAPIIYHKQIRFRLFAKNFGEVVPGTLYRGADQHVGVMRDILRQNEIRTVIDLSGRDPEEDEICRAMGVERFAFELPGDGRGDPRVWAAVLEIIADERRYPIFVHCAAGAQRTTTAVLLYRKFVEDASFQNAYPESFDYRHEPDEWSLMAFLADHADEIEIAWRARVVDMDGDPVPLAQLVDRARTTGEVND